MDLWIRSQDKTKLVKVDKILIENSDIGNFEVGMLGVYKTKERALEVLDEIQEFIENKNKIKITQDVNGITSEVEDAKRVYVMPEE